MDVTVKYQKLASEYSKLRAQASVLKKAVLEEQAKGTAVRAQLRRSEQEKESCLFRNKQLEHRVTVLQDEIATREGRKHEKDHKRKGVLSRIQNDTEGRTTGNGNDQISQDTLIFEELQKKIMENAQLTLSIDDKEHDLKLHTDRIANLEQMLEIRACEQSDLEKQLRRDLETMQTKNSELENKLVEAASIIGSEDALSASGSENTPLANLHHNHVVSQSSSMFAHGHSSDERISLLEKEVLHWRTQYEIAKLKDMGAGNSENDNQLNVEVENLSCCATAAAGISVKPTFAESKSAQRTRDSFQEPPQPPTKEQILYNNFSRKFEDLVKAKCIAETRAFSYEKEAEHLQNCLENATYELKAKDDQTESINQTLRIIEEELATTRFNYEEQISVLTEQLINLSEQLAACK